MHQYALYTPDHLQNYIHTSGNGTLLVCDGAHPAGDSAFWAMTAPTQPLTAPIQTVRAPIQPEPVTTLLFVQPATAPLWPEAASFDGALPFGGGAHTASDGAHPAFEHWRIQPSPMGGGAYFVSENCAGGSRGPIFVEADLTYPNFPLSLRIYATSFSNSRIWVFFILMF